MNRIKELRLEKGWTQKKLADLANEYINKYSILNENKFSRGIILRLENGNSKLSTEQAKVLAKVLDSNVDYLLGLVPFNVKKIKNTSENEISEAQFDLILNNIVSMRDLIDEAQESDEQIINRIISDINEFNRTLKIPDKSISEEMFDLGISEENEERDLLINEISIKMSDDLFLLFLRLSDERKYKLLDYIKVLSDQQKYEQQNSQ